MEDEAVIEKLRRLLQSRRFWAAVSGVALVLLTDACGLSEDDAGKIVALIGAWIVGDSLSKT